MRKSVLIVSYYFPPLGLGGVSRALNLFKLLPGSGWDCDILTVKPVLYRAYEPELLEGLDESRIHRSGSRDPQRILYMLGVRKVKASAIESTRNVSGRFFPDSKVGWVKPAVRLARTLVDNRLYDAIISTSPPVSAHLVAKSLASEMKIPWLADFRDYWTAHKIDQSYSNPKMHSRANDLLASIGQLSTMRTAVNNTVGEYVGADEIICNGYDSDLADLWRRPPPGNTVTIGLLGHQHDSTMIKPLLNLLVALRKKSPDAFERLRVLQVGDVGPSSFRNLFAEQKLDKLLRIEGRLSRVRTIETLNDVALFYIGVADKAYLPGRSFDMIASGRPLLVYAEPDSEYGKLIERIDNGCCFHKNSLESGISYLEEIVSSQDGGLSRITPRPSYAHPYSALCMAEKFAKLLEQIS